MRTTLVKKKTANRESGFHVTTARRLRDNVKKHPHLYLLSIPTLAYFLLFQYGPIYGVQIAFKHFSPSLGIVGSPWVGLEHFQRFFRSYHFWTLIRNTVGISLYQLAAGFPAPIILALMLNQVRNGAFKKSIQMFTYAPHFISVVVLVGMMATFLSPSSGLINQVLRNLGREPIYFLAKPEWFKTLYVFSGVWQNAGFGSIIYLAALSSIDPQQHEAATIDGATKLQRVVHIDVPGILPTIIILLILNTGRIMSVGFEKVFLLQNPLNMISSDVIATYVYRAGLTGGEFSFAASVGLFNSIINCVLLWLVNRLARSVGENSLW